MHFEKNGKKVVAVLLSAIIIFVFSYFLFFSASNFSHEKDCHEKDCPICHELQLASGFLKQFGKALGEIAIALAVFFVVSKFIDTGLNFSIERTLLTDKVRMDC